MSNRTPDWLKKKINPDSSVIYQIKTLISDLHLNTVCQSAKCPNIFECFKNKTATFMLMGDICTRNCGFCGVKSGKPEMLDESEPSRVAEAVRLMGLKYVVITSVTRDDLPDGGGSHFARTIREINELNSVSGIECLIPDFKGDTDTLEFILKQNLSVLNHNMETVRKNFKKVKKFSDYKISLDILKSAKSIKPGIFTKSGFMLGLGEEKEEIIELLADLKKVNCDMVTIGQYLRPSHSNLPVEKYYSPEEFEDIRELAENFGFKAVASGIFVRSSYNAAVMLNEVLRKRKWDDNKFKNIPASKFYL